MYSTLRDWEWMDIGMTTDLEDRDKARVWGMVCADCAFLQRQHLLDYSLLIGIYNPPSSLLPHQKQALLAQLAAQCHGTGVIARDRQKIYFFGLIDVLEKFTIRWRVQRATLRLLYGLIMRWSQSDGISAMPPPLYADRFRTFVAHEVLAMDTEAEPVKLDERWRASGPARWCQALCAIVRGLLALPSLDHHRGARRGGRERWAPLWERRRRGLVKQRIVAEHAEKVARIKELEEMVANLEYELSLSRGVHPAAALSGAAQEQPGAGLSAPGRRSPARSHSIDTTSVASVGSRSTTCSGASRSFLS